MGNRAPGKTPLVRVRELELTSQRVNLATTLALLVPWIMVVARTARQGRTAAHPGSTYAWGVALCVLTVVLPTAINVTGHHYRYADGAEPWVGPLFDWLSVALNASLVLGAVVVLLLLPVK